MNRSPTLQTPRLRLRPFKPTDAAAVQRLAGDRAIADTTLSIPHPYPDGAAQEWISKLQEGFAAGRSVTFAVTLKRGGTLLGAIGLTDIVPGHRAEIGYWLGKPYWNQGYCTEAARAVLRYAFEKMSLVRIHARHLTRNPASGRVMTKLGMRHEGTLRQHAKKWDILEDLECYGILKAEWHASINGPPPRCHRRGIRLQP